MSNWKAGNTNKVCINQILCGFFLGGFLDFLINRVWFVALLCIALAFLNLYIAKHKSPK